MPTYTALFENPVACATYDIEANECHDAFDVAMAWAENTAKPLDLANDHDVRLPVEKITISDDHGNKLLSWESYEFRLRQAAPHLLAALQHAVAQLESSNTNGRHTPAIAQARAAIAAVETGRPL